MVAIGLVGALVAEGSVVLLRSSIGDEGRLPVPATPSDARADPLDGEAISATLIEYARVRDAATFARIPLASEVDLALADRVVMSTPAAGLVDQQQWLIDPGPDGFRERTGPFSALELLASSVDVTVNEGPPHTCTAPNETAPVPAELAAHRMITVGPARGSIAACMQWWAVTMYLDESEAVAGIGLDMGSP